MDLLGHDSVAASCLKCLSLLLAACLPSAFIIAFTPKSGINALARLAWVVVIFSIGKELFQEVSAIISSIAINDLVNGYLAFVLLQCCNLLVIGRLDEEDLLKGHVFQRSDGYLYKLFRTACLMFNLRGVGTLWQIKRLNKFPRFYSRHCEDGKPTRGWYLLRQLLIISWQYLFLDIVFTSSMDTPPEDTERLFGHGKEFLYLDATAEQWAARIGVSLVSWLGPARVTIDMAYRSVSVASVLLGITPPEAWPPLFGSIWDAYTIRGCWSTFWHQSFRWPLTSVSNFVCHDLLRLPQRSLLTRYLNVCIVFFVSGVVHLALDSFSSQPPPMAPALAFFSSFAIAILIEELFQGLYCDLSPRNEGQSVPLWQKLVGYLWVAFWLAMTSPWYLYHATRLPSEMKWLVPVSVVSSIGVLTAHVLLAVGGLILKFAMRGEL